MTCRATWLVEGAHPSAASRLAFFSPAPRLAFHHRAPLGIISKFLEQVSVFHAWQRLHCLANQHVP